VQGKLISQLPHHAELVEKPIRSAKFLQALTGQFLPSLDLVVDWVRTLCAILIGISPIDIAALSHRTS
jgi:hypothetical protein